MILFVSIVQVNAQTAKPNAESKSDAELIKQAALDYIRSEL